MTERLAKVEGMVAYVRRPGSVAVLVALLLAMGMVNIFTGLAATVGGLAAYLPAFTTTTTAGLLNPVTSSAIGIFLIAVGVVDIIIAWGLYDLRTWGWGWALGFSIGNVLLLPVGTILGVLGIIFLSFEETRDAYREHGAPLRQVSYSRQRPT